MILITKIPVAMSMAKQPEGYDNRYPRDQQAKLTGFGKRCVAAHNNTLEAFPLFAAGVLIAIWGEVELDLLSNLAIAFVASRVIYTAAYWADINLLRSTAWTVGFVVSVTLMFLALP